MGFIFKDSRGRSPHFYLGYRLANGRWKKVSSKTSDKAQARLMLQGLETAEALASRGSATEEQIRKVMTETIERVTGRVARDPSIAEWLEEWLNLQRGTVAKKTFERYAQVVRDLEQTLGGEKSGRLRQLEREVFFRHRDRLLADGCSPSTVNHAFKTLVDIFGAAERDQLLSINPARLKALRAEKSDRRPFTPEQLQALLAAAKGDMYGLVLIGAYTGQRLMDIATLRWSQVDLVAGIIQFRQRKGQKDLAMPIHSQVADYLLSRAGDQSPDAPVFPGLAFKSGSGSSGLSVQFSRLMAAARIDAGLVRERTGNRGRNTHSLSFHSLRYSFNSWLANGDVSQELRRKLTGHTTGVMNDTYTRLELATLRRAVESLPAIPAACSTSKTGS
jgi:integrase